MHLFRDSQSVPCLLTAPQEESCVSDKIDHFSAHSMALSRPDRLFKELLFLSVCSFSFWLPKPNISPHIVFSAVDQLLHRCGDKPRNAAGAHDHKTHFRADTKGPLWDDHTGQFLMVITCNGQSANTAHRYRHASHYYRMPRGPYFSCNNISVPYKYWFQEITSNIKEQHHPFLQSYARCMCWGCPLASHTRLASIKSGLVGIKTITIQPSIKYAVQSYSFFITSLGPIFESYLP